MRLTMNILDATDTPWIEDHIATRTGGLAFDIGSCAGRTANLLAANFDEVIACEPSPYTFDELAKNALPNVAALHLAVSEQPGDLILTERDFTRARGYLFTGDSLPEWGHATGTITVTATTLDELAGQYGHPDFVKIDTEGHEVHVVNGGKQTFAAGCEFVIEIHSEPNGQEIAEVLGGELVRHAHHQPGSYPWRNHYWLVGSTK